MQFQQLDVYHRVEICVAGVHSTWSKLWLNWCSCSRAPGFSTELLERIPKTPDTIFRTMVGVAQHALQEPRQSQQHDDGLNSNGDQATLPLPIGILHHARTVLAPQDSLSELHTFFMHVFATTRPSAPRRYLVKVSATHSTSQVSTGCWLGMLPLSLRSRANKCSRSKLLNTFSSFVHRAVAFRPLEGQIRLEERQPRGASSSPP